MSEKDKLSAQVIVRPAGGKSDIAPENITSENVHRIMPAPAELEKVKIFFQDSGFEVGSGFANSFSITGEKKLFEKIFETKISTNENQAVKSRGGDSENETSELSLTKLPGDIKKIVEAVTFTEPPDFGPGNFS